MYLWFFASSVAVYLMTILKIEVQVTVFIGILYVCSFYFDFLTKVAELVRHLNVFYMNIFFRLTVQAYL